MDALLKPAAAQVHARHAVAALAVTNDAAARVQPRAVLDVGLLVLAHVLGAHGRRARERERQSERRAEPRPRRGSRTHVPCEGFGAHVFPR